MSLQIYNTLSRQKEEFKPLNEGKVGMYVCGVTVYDDCHLGHARALINFDVIYRHLQSLGYDVTYVRNYTDVDDKIIDRANQDGAAWNEISEKYIKHFNRDMDALGNVKPTIEPKATENIDEIIKVIQALVDKGFAYQAGDDVFYSVRKKQDYGKLSGKKIDELEVGARIEVHEDKKDPLDFTLWKSSKPGEPAWDSPWGSGRPGWHIECSAMSMRFLGETFDIHGGGRDLSFPHHENEIAQSEAASGKPFAKSWVHNGFVNINSVKMSKSLGNFLTINQILKQFHPEVIRLFVLAAHYRSPLDYTEDSMESTRQSLLRWYTTLDRIVAQCDGEAKDQLSDLEKELATKVSRFDNDFKAAMNDDFNTAKAVGLLFDLVRDWNKVLDESQAVCSKLCQAFKTSVAKVHNVLGLFGSEAQAFLQAENQRGLESSGLTADAIEAKLAERDAARQAKDWAKADAVRDELLKAGVSIKDNPDGTTSWSFE